MITLDDLLETGKINQAQYDMYALYEVHELGRKLLRHGMNNTFMDNVPLKELSGERLAYNEGRRSIFREVYEAVIYVDDLLKGISNDDGSQQQ
jgi:hypothetical protein